MGICSFFARHFARHCRRSDWAVRRLSCKLKLDDRQKQRLRALLDGLEQLRESVRRSWSSQRQELFKLIGGERFDRNEALRIAQIQTALINESLPQLLDSLGDFYDNLTAEQRGRLRDVIAKRMDHCCCGH
jgi:periplasmic protein CpxP/Spy